MSASIIYNNNNLFNLADGEQGTLRTGLTYVPYDISITDTTDVTAALTAIQNKGVTIPNGAGREDLASLINQISVINLDNDTVTAATLGKGITAHDSSGQAITGTAYLHNESSKIDWMGIEPTFVQYVYQNKVFLKDTDFATWTPSGTAKVIIPAETLSAVTLDMDNYEYWLIWQWYVDIDHVSGATLKATVQKQFGAFYTYIMRRPAGLSAITTEEDNRNVAANITPTGVYLFYYTTSGVRTNAFQGSYGFYGVQSTVTISDINNATTTVTPVTPIMYARCNSSYFSTSAAAEVDQNTSYITIVGELYRVKRGSGAPGEFWRYPISMANTPLTINT